MRKCCVGGQTLTPSHTASTALKPQVRWSSVEADMAAPPGQYNQWQAPPPPVDGSNDEVRTIFVLGFPPDVKERELQNLLRWWPGYEASQMNFKSDQPMGFALFSTAAMAMAARDALQNLVFDADTNSVLRAEMAKKNLYVKRGVTGETMSGIDASKRMRTGGGDYSPTPYAPSYPAQGLQASAPSWGPQSYAPPQSQYESQYTSYAVAQPPAAAPAGYAPVQNIKDNPPCNTLFVGNLGEAVVETEVRGLFCGQPGFRQMKVLRQGKNTVCFIEFMDVGTAIAVHQNLQGAILTTSDRGGMRIQYSKNPYGRKREGGAGAQHDTEAPGVSSAPGVEVNGGLDHALPPVPATLSQLEATV